METHSRQFHLHSRELRVQKQYGISNYPFRAIEWPVKKIITVYWVLRSQRTLERIRIIVTNILIHMSYTSKLKRR